MCNPAVQRQSAKPPNRAAAADGVRWSAATLPWQNEATKLDGIILILVILAFFAVGGYNYVGALNDIRDRLPKSLQDPVSAKFALDLWVWDPVMPARARRRYLMCLVCFSATMACMTCFMLLNGRFWATALFGAVFLYFVGHTSIRWRRYKDRL
jgi:hypothetical protein